jgi:predicted ArsR family transcriptional regulator
MSVQRYSETSPAGTILRHLQRQGQATIKELEEVLGVSTTAVREHLVNLQVDGLIATRSERRGPGRPRLVYALTDKARSQFPKQYDTLIKLVLREIGADEGPAKVEQILARVSQRLADEYSDHIQGVDVKARLAELRTLLESRGVPAEVAPDGDAIRLFACPYYDIAQAHPEVCSMERQMIEYVLGEKVAIGKTIREGHHNCQFVVTE